MRGKEIRNVTIKSTNLGGSVGNGMFLAWLNLEWPGGGISFGGYGLDEYDKTLERRVDKTGTGLEFIRAILDALGADDWEQLKGKNIRADLQGLGGKCLGVGNLLEDKWFYAEDFFEFERKRVGKDFK